MIWRALSPDWPERSACITEPGREHLVLSGASLGDKDEASTGRIKSADEKMAKSCTMEKSERVGFIAMERWAY
jgi:hypothetical protein